MQVTKLFEVIQFRMITNRIDKFCASLTVRAAAIGLAYFVAAELGHLLSVKASDQLFATFWPPAGLLLATLVLNEWRVWPAMLLAASGANLASNTLHGISLPVNLAFCLANGTEACIGAWLLRRYVGMPITLASIQNVLGLACLSAMLSAMFGATIGAITVKVAFNAPLSTNWPMWWVADALGILVVAPVVISGVSQRTSLFKDVKPRKLAEGLVLFLGMSVVDEAVYGDWLPPPLNVPVFILPFLIWAALRFGPGGAGTAILIVGVIGIWDTSHGHGPYAVMTAVPGERLVRAQATLCVINLCVLLLAATVAERKQAEQLRTKLIDDLQQALREIKTLREFIPLCAWCKKIRNDQGYWLGLEDYLRAHSGAELTHGICPECVEKQMARARSAAPGRKPR